MCKEEEGGKGVLKYIPCAQPWPHCPTYEMAGVQIHSDSGPSWPMLIVKCRCSGVKVSTLRFARLCLAAIQYNASCFPTSAEL
mmetsp:Transcript_20861/g.28082  ORF Transcript_20861/g.28082 Transcript_20861/m.28082 type:complete len:83 (-) Transcript_20861:1-249(-)